MLLWPSAWLRYEVQMRNERKNKATAVFHKKNGMLSYVHFLKKGARWPWIPHLNPATTTVCHQTRAFRFSFYVSAPQPSCSRYGSQNLAFLFFADSRVTAPCRRSPSNSRLNDDVHFLKCPSAHCCCTELSFVCGLLTWISSDILLWLLPWASEVQILKAASDILWVSRIKLSYSLRRFPCRLFSKAEIGTN